MTCVVHGDTSANEDGEHQGRCPECEPDAAHEHQRTTSRESEQRAGTDGWVYVEVRVILGEPAQPNEE